MEETGEKRAEIRNFLRKHAVLFGFLFTAIYSILLLVVFVGGYYSGGSDGINMMIDVTEKSPVCRVQFILAGTKTNYNMKYFHSWLDMTNGSLCTIDFIKPDHPMILDMLSKQELQALKMMRRKPVIQADYLKFVTMHYLGGVSADFDVEARAPVLDWFSRKYRTEDCMLLLGVEHGCWDDECIESNNFAAHGQIENWVAAAHQKGSKFLKYYMSRVETELLDAGGLDEHPDTQHIAGSGIISKIIREVLGQDYGDIRGHVEGKTLKESKDEIVKFTFYGETICILGDHYFRGGDKLAEHHFEGSWK